MLGKGFYRRIEDPKEFVDKRVLIVDRGKSSVDVALDRKII
jgi:hypothetical protein